MLVDLDKNMQWGTSISGLPGGAAVKNLPASAGDTRNTNPSPHPI